MNTQMDQTTWTYADHAGRPRRMAQPAMESGAGRSMRPSMVPAVPVVAVDIAFSLATQRWYAAGCLGAPRGRLGVRRRGAKWPVPGPRWPVSAQAPAPAMHACHEGQVTAVTARASGAGPEFVPRRPSRRGPLPSPAARPPPQSDFRQLAPAILLADTAQRLPARKRNERLCRTAQATAHRARAPRRIATALPQAAVDRRGHCAGGAGGGAGRRAAAA